MAGSRLGPPGPKTSTRYTQRASEVSLTWKPSSPKLSISWPMRWQAKDEVMYTCPSAEGERGRHPGEHDQRKTRNATHPAVAEHQGVAGLRDVVARCRDQDGADRDVGRDGAGRAAREAEHEGVAVRRANDRREDADPGGAEVRRHPAREDGEDQEDHGEEERRADLERVTERLALRPRPLIAGAAAEVEGEPAGGARPGSEPEQAGDQRNAEGRREEQHEHGEAHVHHGRCKHGRARIHRDVRLLARTAGEHERGGGARVGAPEKGGDGDALARPHERLRCSSREGGTPPPSDCARESGAPMMPTCSAWASANCSSCW